MRRTRVLPFHVATGMPLDVVLRPKDMEDARSLWRAHGSSADRRRVVRLLRLLEEALGQSDLIPGFDAIATKHNRN